MPSKPILPLCICGNPLCKIPYGYCHCGCGIKTKIPRYSHKGDGRVAIKVDGILIHLGSFPKDRLVEAAKAYDAGAIKYHGEFARLNFPQVSE